MPSSTSCHRSRAGLWAGGHTVSPPPALIELALITFLGPPTFQHPALPCGAITVAGCKYRLAIYIACGHGWLLMSVPAANGGWVCCSPKQKGHLIPVTKRHVLHVGRCGCADGQKLLWTVGDFIPRAQSFTVAMYDESKRTPGGAAARDQDKPPPTYTVSHMCRGRIMTPCNYAPMFLLFVSFLVL